MRRIAALFVCLIALFATSPAEAGIISSLKRAVGISKKEKKPAIKVLLAGDLDGAMVEITGSYNIIDPKTGSRLGTRFSGKNSFMQPLPNGIRWGEEFPGIYQIALIPDDETTSILLNGQQYHGNLLVYNLDNQLHFVNEIEIESYVRDTLSAQFQGPEPVEVLSAVAIAQRTSAYYLTQNNPKAYFHIRAQDAGYLGHAVFTPHHDVHRAVDSTRGVVMLNEVHAPFAAKWTENSGGKTAPYHVIYRRNAGAPVRAVEAPFAARDRGQTKWEASIPLEQLSHIAQLADVRNLHLYTDAESGKVYGVRLEGPSGTTELEFHELQAAVGKEQLQSSSFSAFVEGNTVVFEGYGKGDGVGLCLYEAKEMADRGREAPEILNHFFPGTEIKYIQAVAQKSKVVREGKSRIHTATNRGRG